MSRGLQQPWTTIKTRVCALVTCRNTVFSLLLPTLELPMAGPLSAYLEGRARRDIGDGFARRLEIRQAEAERLTSRSKRCPRCDW